MSHDESMVFEILPGKIGKLSGENVREHDRFTVHAVLDSMVTLCAKIHHTHTHTHTHTG